jgi:hypothetical protein
VPRLVAHSVALPARLEERRAGLVRVSVAVSERRGLHPRRRKPLVALPELGCDFFAAGTHTWIIGVTERERARIAGGGTGWEAPDVSRSLLRDPVTSRPYRTGGHPIPSAAHTVSALSPALVARGDGDVLEPHACPPGYIWVNGACWPLPSVRVGRSL